jgi:hypothetical protein
LGKRDNSAGEYIATLTHRRPNYSYRTNRTRFWWIRAAYAPFLALLLTLTFALMLMT